MCHIANLLQHPRLACRRKQASLLPRPADWVEIASLLKRMLVWSHLWASKAREELVDTTLSSIDHDASLNRLLLIKAVTSPIFSLAERPPGNSLT